MITIKGVLASTLPFSTFVFSLFSTNLFYFGSQDSGSSFRLRKCNDSNRHKKIHRGTSSF
jgi:hypothetical protein